MRMASKSAIGFAISKGLERNKVILHFLRRFAAAGGSYNSGQRIVTTSIGRMAPEQSLRSVFQNLQFVEILRPVETLLATSLP